MSNSPGRRPLEHHVHSAARLVSSTAGVSEAFRALARFPNIWKTESFQYLADVRKCWCDEEVENYIWTIFHQWHDITLQWDASIVPYMDIKFITDIQARAPCFSKSDHRFVQDLFETGNVLTHIQDPALKDRVREAVCRQGPILTLETFARDVRLLYTRVHQPMAHLLCGMRRSKNVNTKNDTLRARICNIFRKEYDELSSSEMFLKDFHAEKKLVVERCYQHVFLHAIRTKLSKNSIDEAQLKELLNRELVKLHGQVGVRRFSASFACQKPIATAAPKDTEAPMPELGDKKNRNGESLFNAAAATKLLYYDQWHKPIDATAPFTTPHMAKHITRVFLLGRTACDTAEASPSGITVLTQQPSLDAANLAGFGTPDGSSPNIILSSVSAISSQASNLERVSAPERVPSSIAASHTRSNRLSKGSASSSSLSPKRPMSICKLGSTLHTSSSAPSASVKRPRLSNFAEGVRPVMPLSGSERNVRNTKRRGRVYQEQRKLPVSAQDSTPTSHAMSPNTCCHVSPSTSSNYSRATADTSKPFGSYDAQLFSKPNEFEIGTLTSSPSEQSTGYRSTYNWKGPNATPAKQSPIYAGNQTDETYSHHPVESTTESYSLQEVQFVNRNSGTGYRFPPTSEAVRQFCLNQDTFDISSTYYYVYDGQIHSASGPEQLMTAIHDYKAEKIFVDSDCLGSTDILPANLL